MSDSQPTFMQRLCVQGRKVCQPNDDILTITHSKRHILPSAQTRSKCAATKPDISFNSCQILQKWQDERSSRVNISCLNPFNFNLLSVFEYYTFLPFLLYLWPSKVSLEPDILLWNSNAWCAPPRSHNPDNRCQGKEQSVSSVFPSWELPATYGIIESNYNLLDGF